MFLLLFQSNHQLYFLLNFGFLLHSQTTLKLRHQPALQTQLNKGLFIIIRYLLSSPDISNRTLMFIFTEPKHILPFNIDPEILTRYPIIITTIYFLNLVLHILHKRNLQIEGPPIRTDHSVMNSCSTNTAFQFVLFLSINYFLYLR